MKKILVLIIGLTLVFSVNASAFVSNVFNSPEITKVFITPTYALPTGSVTKIPLDTVKFDKNSAWVSATKRLIPQRAGYYQVNECIGYNIIAGTRLILYLYKNGGMINEAWAHGSFISAESICLSDIVYMNGTTDYLEMYAVQNTGADTTIWGSVDGHNTYISIVFVGN